MDLKSHDHCQSDIVKNERIPVQPIDSADSQASLNPTSQLHKTSTQNDANVQQRTKRLSEFVVSVQAPNEASVGVRLICISDTHDFHLGMPRPLPHADILVHAGDFTCRGSSREVDSFLKWICFLLESGTVSHVVFVAGNHELGLEPGRAKHPAVIRSHEKMRQSLKDIPNVHYLEDSGCTIKGIRFYGSPWTLPLHGKVPGDWAFQLRDNPKDIGRKFQQIPDSVDVLVTHMMPFGHGDALSPSTKTLLIQNNSKQTKMQECNPLPHEDGCQSVSSTNDKHTRRRVGSKMLMQRVREIEPVMHVFGHFHAGHGISHQNGLMTTFINAAICDEDYQPDQPPIVVIFKPKA